ncbi:MAG TPA: hypothetical protein DDX04_14150 [Massilia sp.]|nr:hypothetical protein [Massilia sp.]
MKLPFLILAALLPGMGAAAPMQLADYMALTGPAPDAHVAYGPAPSQYAELFVPKGAGPFPVAVLVHGGCWTAKFGGITQLRNMAGALRERGIADERIAAMVCPIGLPGIAGKAPAVIAVGVAAQLLTVWEASAAADGYASSLPQASSETKDVHRTP